jgi:phosphosulfolactate synthase (CoM biosynthesis protein A)
VGHTPNEALTGGRSRNDHGRIRGHNGKRQKLGSDVAAKFVTAIGLEHLMFEAADPEVFAWYIKDYGPSVNLFVDHSQIVQLECLRSGIWGTKSTWGRILTYDSQE